MGKELMSQRNRQIAFPRNSPTWPRLSETRCSHPAASERLAFRRNAATRFPLWPIVAMLPTVLICILLAGATAGAIEPLRRGHTRPACLPGVPCADYQYRARSPSQTAVSRTAILLRTKVSVEAVLQQDTVRLSRQYSDEQVIRRYPETRERHIERHIGQRVLLPENVSPQVPELEFRSGALPPLPEDDLSDQSQPNITRRLLTQEFSASSPSPPPKERSVIALYQLSQSRLQIDHCEISEVALQLYSDGRWILSLRADQNRRPGEGEPLQFNPQLHLKRNQFAVRLRCLGAFQNEPTEAAMAVGRPVLADLQPHPFWVENGQPRYLRAGDHDGWVEEHFAEIDRVEIEFYYFRQQGLPVAPRGQ
jgi:hypothetical protein